MSKKKNKNMPLSLNWKTSDDAELKLLLDKKVSELSKKVSKAKNPSEKKRYKYQKKKYQEILQKVKRGDYGSEAFFLNEQNKGVYVNPYPTEDYSNAESAYDEIDFKYDEYFRKKRYYGFVLPFLLFVLMAAYVVLPFLGNILPTKTLNTMGEKSLHLGAIFTYKLDAKTDLTIKNDGNWPTGVWADGKFLKQGEKYQTSRGTIPDTVNVYEDLGLRSIDITGLDMIKAVFYTELFAETRIDFIEDMPFLKNRESWYYAKFMLDKDLTVRKNAEGEYEIEPLLRVLSTHILVYGFVLGFLAAALSAVFALISLFGYTSRRIHILPLISFIVSILVFLLPVFLMLGKQEGDTFTKQLGLAFGTYFAFTNTTFGKSEKYMLMVGILPIVNVAISFFALLLPKMFKNKTAKYQTFVPKGNKPRRGTYDSLNA